MKVYRVIPNSFLTNEKLASTELTGLEDIYYKMGYVSFVGKRGYHAFNNIHKNIDEEGKYVYLFPEDAILEGNSLIGGFHRLNTNSFLVVEYDVSEDLVLKNLGYGDYTTDIMPWYIMESFIPKSEFGGKINNTENISKREKEDFLVERLNDSLKEIKEFGDWEEIMYYSELFGMNPFDGSLLSTIIDDKERLKEVLLESNFYHMYLKENGELVKTPYITGKIIPVNIRHITHKFHNWNNAAEYFQEMGIRYDVTKEHNEFKNELIHYSDDKEKVKSLLKERKYI